MAEKPEEKPDESKRVGEIKFKALAIRQDVPMEFWKKKKEVVEEDEPTIVEVKDVNEGVPVRGKCIVCYKPIYDTETEKQDLFSCPNCSREAHYLCATIFITEHKICPVCSSKLELDKETGKYIVVKK